VTGITGEECAIGAIHRGVMRLAAALVLLAGAGSAAAAPRTRVDVEAAQAILAVQRLDGWLLAQTGSQNPVAADLVAPVGATQQWFYWIPAQGEPVALVHQGDMAGFNDVPGKKVEYAVSADMKKKLRAMLKGARKVAMEYAPQSKIPALTRVDAATVKMVRGQGIKISSSAELVQFTKSLWGPDGRVAHYVAIHHLARLKDAALRHLARELRAGRQVSEHDLQKIIERGFEVRGLEGPPPIVAAGVNTGDPSYVPSAQKWSSIKEGDLVLLDLSARVSSGQRAIYARLSWVAYVGDAVPDKFAQPFAQVAAARDAALRFLEDRTSRKRVVKGFEVDQQARGVLGKAGLGDKFSHPTGHSLDTSLHGDGANIDDHQTKDTRNLVMGSGFTVGPGVYSKGDFGLRSVVDVYIGRRGVEVTSPTQQQVTAVLAP
jgi:Xaa-Pro dipeptidase